MLTGLCICFSHNSFISFGIVAENSNLTIFLGSLLSIPSTWLINPILSIRSPSSIAKYLIFSILRLSLSIWSNILPGVPTTIWVFCFKVLICSFIGDLPYIATLFSLLYLPIFKKSSFTWTANSLVGLNTNTWGKFSSQSHFSHKGIANAAVFPEPVWDLTIRSLLSIISCITLSWTSEGDL